MQGTIEWAFDKLEGWGGVGEEGMHFIKEPLGYFDDESHCLPWLFRPEMLSLQSPGLTPKSQDLHLADGLHLAIVTITNYVHNVWIM